MVRCMNACAGERQQRHRQSLRGTTIGTAHGFTLPSWAENLGCRGASSKHPPVRAGSHSARRFGVSCQKRLKSGVAGRFVASQLPGR